MSASKTIVILGARGALGQSIHARFAQEKWKQVLVGVSPDTVIRDVNSVYVNIGGVTSSQKQFDLISSNVSSLLGPDVSRIDAIVNVSGGFCMDSADTDSIFSNLESMYSSSVVSSAIAVHLAALFLRPGGILVLPGAAACAKGTPWALTYGSMKAAVHHMVASLAGSNNGLPDGVVTVGIAPVMLDTPANRAAMPDANRNTWTQLDDVADKIFEWVSGRSVPNSGTVYKIVSDNSKGETNFIAM